MLEGSTTFYTNNEIHTGRRVSGPPLVFGLTIGDLSSFSTWLTTRRKLSSDTATRYIQEIKKAPKHVTPQYFIDNYSAWRYNAFRLYVHYLYQTGLLEFNDKMRWLDLLKTTKNNRIEPPEITPEQIRTIMKDTSSLIQILFYGGIRITEANHLMLNRDTIKSEDFGDYIRYSVKWFRGPKRCDYVYLPKFVTIPKIHKPLDLDHLWRNKNSNNLKLLRKFFYRTAKQTALENRFDPLIADFYQSRVSKFSIGEKHYGELKSEANALYPLVIQKLSWYLSAPTTAPAPMPITN